MAIEGAKKDEKRVVRRFRWAAGAGIAVL